MFVHKALGFLDHFHNEIEKQPRISSESKWALITRLEQELMFLKCTEIVPSEQQEQPNRNPLLNEVVLKEVIGYLTVPAKSSYQTLQNSHLVCQQWNRAFASEVQKRSIIKFKESFGPRSEYDVFMLMETFPKEIFLEKRWISLRIDRPDWFENEQFRHWISECGSKLIGLELACKISIQDMVSLLHDWCPNLEDLTLENVICENNSNKKDSKDTPNKSLKSVNIPPQLKLQNLTIIHKDNSTNIEKVMEAAVQVLLQVERLITLSLELEASRSPLGLGIARLFSNSSRLIQERVDILTNLNKLELGMIFCEDLYPILNELHLVNLKELYVDLFTLNPLQDFLETLTSLEKLDLLLKFHPAETDFVFPEMPKLKHFTYVYSHQSILVGDQVLEIILSVGSFIHLFPDLISWTALQRSRFERKTVFFGDWHNCANSVCNHVQELLVTTDDDFPKHDLQHLNFGCSLRRSGMILRISHLFQNLKHIEIWIDSTNLYNYFFNLKSLRQLEVIKIELNRSVDDLPLALNDNLPSLSHLRELSMEKCRSFICNPGKDYWGAVTLYNLNAIHTGITKCDSLKILSFTSFKIDPVELEDLRLKILATKSSLALNVK